MKVVTTNHGALLLLYHSGILENYCSWDTLVEQLTLGGFED